MKKCHVRSSWMMGLIALFAISLIGCAMLGWEKEVKVTLDQVPAPVKAALEKEAEGGTLKAIEKSGEEGKAVYEADIVKGGKEVEVKVAEDGKVLKRKNEAEEKDEKDEKGEKNEKAEEKDENAVKMTLEQVPAAVKATLEQESQGGKITALEQETEGGQRVYSADLEIGGKAGEVLVSQDGKVVKREGAAEKSGK